MDKSIYAPVGTLTEHEAFVPGVLASNPNQFIKGELIEYGLIIQGDIILPKSFAIDNNAEPFPRSDIFSSESITKDGLHQDVVGGAWPGGIVPFTCHASLVAVVNAAIAEWEKFTAVQFINFDPMLHRSFAHFQPNSKNASPVGCYPGENPVLLRPSVSLPTVLHEIGHLLGLWHEHARHDRDNYILYMPENVHEGFRSQFDPIPGLPDSNIQYDFVSIMHYPSDMFAKPGTKTIERIDGKVLKTNVSISIGDALKIMEIYPDLDDWLNKSLSSFV